MPRPSLVLLFAAALCSSLAAQTLSGLYTLDRTKTGPRNFRSFVEANYNLTRFGVGGPVTIEVADGTHPNTDTWVTTPVPGASVGRKVTFRSKTKHGAIIPNDLRPSMGGYVALTQWIVLDGFRFVRAPNFSRAGLFIGTNVQFIEIRNCHFEGAPLAIGESFKIDLHHCLFSSPVPVRDLLDVGFADELTVHHNEFRVTNTAVAFSLDHRPNKPTQTRIYNNLFWGTPRRGYPVLRLVAQETRIDHNTFAIFAGNGWTDEVLEIYGYPGLWNDVRNNIFYSEGAGGLLQLSPFLPYHHFFDRNIYWVPNGKYLVSYPQSNKPDIQYANLAAWRFSTGQDGTGFQADPQLINLKTAPYDLRPRAGSVAVGKALNTQSWITDDFDGDARLKPATIGAYESIADFATFGKGCAGTSNLVPVLAHVGSLKHGSKSFAVTLSNAAPITSQSFLTIGASNTKWGTVPLPFPLGGGCSLLVSLDIVLAIPVSSGKASFPVNIPTAPQLRGARAHFQWGVVDPAAGGIGLAMSNGGTLTL